MKYFCFQLLIKFLSISVLALSCNTKKNAANHEEINFSTKNSIKIDSTFYKLFSQYISSYEDVIALDTTLNHSNDKIHVDFKYYCLYDSAMKIPEEYNWGYGSVNFITHNFVCDIRIKKNDETIIDDTVNKETFNTLLTEELNKYGVLLYPSFREFDDATGELIFHFSISIPVTDIGTSATYYVDLDGNTRTSKY
jgi:hypothetical protein